jgi:TetR/AcrR family transcriptional regulator, cholesterol catabolism regulator
MATAGTSQTTRAAETAARRRRLIDAALSLAREGGYDAVQMRDVAARAEVALGTLYRQFSSKDQLLLAALADQADALRTRLAQRPPRGDAPGDRVADVLRRATRALTREPSTTAAMVTALSSPEAGAATAKAEVYSVMRTIIGGAIDGDDVPDIDGVLRVLGYVWLATLSAWVGGMTDADGMADDLSTAAHLLLR